MLYDEGRQVRISADDANAGSADDDDAVTTYDDKDVNDAVTSAVDETKKSMSAKMKMCC